MGVIGYAVMTFLISWISDTLALLSVSSDAADAHLAELETVAPAIRVDGQDLFWWGSRTPDALHRLHRRLGDVLHRR